MSNDTLKFIKLCIKKRKIYWTYGESHEMSKLRRKIEKSCY
jgi:hypothetical protein